MRRVAENWANGTVTYEVSPGRYVDVDPRVVRVHGLETIAEHLGIKLPTGRTNVMQHGRIVGTVPAAFDPLFIKSKSFLYDPRPGDFIREGNVWIANRTLGYGDLEAVPEFVFATPQGESR